MIEDNPWSIATQQSGDASEAAYIEEEFEKQYKDYFENANIEFDKSKVNLVKTDIEDLIDEDDLINYTNKEIEREVEQGNLMYAPDISDYVDPKDD